MTQAAPHDRGVHFKEDTDRETYRKVRPTIPTGPFGRVVRNIAPRNVVLCIEVKGRDSERVVRMNELIVRQHTY